MIIEIKGTQNSNKGAEMMLLTILQELKKYDESIIFTVRPSSLMPYEFYAPLGIRPKASLITGLSDFTSLLNKIPVRYLSYFGIVPEKKIDAVLDASGFSYSDQKPLRTAVLMQKMVRRMKKNGTKFIFLPQAFGPFTGKKIRFSMGDVLGNADKVYGRDATSVAYVQALGLPSSKIVLAPDFTSLFEGKKPAYAEEYAQRVCVVTNARMVDHHTDPTLYYDLLKRAITYMVEQGEKPYFLIHSAEDKKVALQVNELLESPIPILDEANPYFIKYLIKHAKGVVASRYHSIASALNSGTVAIGTSWSHKYQHLYDEFQFSEGLINLSISDEELHRALDCILVEQQRTGVQQRITLKGKEIQESSTQLFAEVAALLGLATKRV